MAGRSALDLADGDPALAERMVDAYVDTRRHYGNFSVDQVADDLEWFTMTPKERRDSDRAQRRARRKDEEAEERPAARQGRVRRPHR